LQIGGQRFLILPAFRYEHAAGARILQRDGIEEAPVSSRARVDYFDMGKKLSVVGRVHMAQPIMMVTLSSLLIVSEFTELGSGERGAMEDGDEQRPLPMDISMTLSSLQRQARNVSRKWISTASTCRFSSAAIPPERAARAGIRTYASG